MGKQYVTIDSEKESRDPFIDPELSIREELHGILEDTRPEAAGSHPLDLRLEAASHHSRRHAPVPFATYVILSQQVSLPEGAGEMVIRQAYTMGLGVDTRDGIHFCPVLSPVEPEQHPDATRRERLPFHKLDTNTADFLLRASIKIGSLNN